MASSSASCLSFQPLLLRPNKATLRNISLKWGKHGLSRFSVSCAAKPETMNKVCDIVRTQLALSPDIKLTPESKFSELGADSLDTVEIVMGLEEEFQISVEEDSSQNITTVQEAAELIEKLVQKKSETAS